MKGKVQIKIKNRKCQFEFEIERNITIVRGDSGTGKTTLFNMISEYTRLKEESGINLQCSKKCIALTDIDWEHQLEQAKDSVVFIDEGDRFVSSKDFANIIRNSDNYYVLFVRENLHELPYSVNEIYEIHTSGKIHTFKRIYKPKKGYIYVGTKKRKIKKILVEDSKSGFQFFDNYFSKQGVVVHTAQGNSNICNWIEEHKEEEIFVIADGAAFGSEMNRIVELQHRFPANITVCLPESFEWMIIKSELIQYDGLNDVIENPSNYIKSEKYFSWEQFFTDYLTKITKDTHMSYTKSKINNYYIIENNAKKIAAIIML